jgi:ribosomal protein S18 acetylase RimI-like enzyme
MADTARGVAVRPLRTEDFDRWKELWLGYLSFYRQELTDDITSTVFERLSTGERDTIGLAAVDAENEPVGIAHLVFHATTWSASDKCYLEDLYVDPSYRGEKPLGPYSTRSFSKHADAAASSSIGTPSSTTAPRDLCTTASAG